MVTLYTSIYSFNSLCLIKCQCVSQYYSDLKAAAEKINKNTLNPPPPYISHDYTVAHEMHFLHFRMNF